MNIDHKDKRAGLGKIGLKPTDGTFEEKKITIFVRLSLRLEIVVASGLIAFKLKL